MDWDQEENETKLTSKKEYDCVICNQTTPSSEDKPMGLVVLVQVSVLIFCRTKNVFLRVLRDIYAFSRYRQLALLATNDNNRTG